MALSQDFKQTVAERVRRDPAFARALLDEAATLFLNGEPHAARLILRDLVYATIGFEVLAAETAKPAKSLHRMLSKKGNPTMDNLAAILGVVRRSWEWIFRLTPSRRREECFLRNAIFVTARRERSSQRRSVSSAAGGRGRGDMALKRRPGRIGDQSETGSGRRRMRVRSTTVMDRSRSRVHARASTRSRRASISLSL